ncbi:MAG TPA: hypothetical protein DIT49_04780 [Clostridiales bacterium]|nr:hypothetical protein [Clostridiales bacterium]
MYYPRLERAMARDGLGLHHIAAALHCSAEEAGRLLEEDGLSLSQARQVRDAMFPTARMEWLFAQPEGGRRDA